MESLTERISTQQVVESAPVPENVENEHVHPDEVRLKALVDQDDYQEAFFLARRLLANGEDWAQPWLDEIKQRMS